MQFLLHCCAENLRRDGCTIRCCSPDVVYAAAGKNLEVCSERKSMKEDEGKEPERGENGIHREYNNKETMAEENMLRKAKSGRAEQIKRDEKCKSRLNKSDLLSIVSSVCGSESSIVCACVCVRTHACEMTCASH